MVYVNSEKVVAVNSRPVCSSPAVSRPLGHPPAPALALTTSPVSPVAEEPVCHKQRLENCLRVRPALPPQHCSTDYSSISASPLFPD